MKNLFVILVTVIFSAGFVFAQNNSSDVDQNGVSNQALVVQTGSDNISFVDQNLEGGIANGNDLLDLKQIGSDNVSKLAQTTHNNDADVFQDGNRNLLRNNYMYSGHGDFAFQRVKNTMELDQLGDDNELGLYQTNQKNKAWVLQDGDKNIAEVWQRAFGGPVTGNETDIDQIGFSNDAESYQKGDLNDALIYQLGDNNDSEISQDGPNVTPAGGLSNSAPVEIYGDWNTTTETQYGDNNTSTVRIGFQSSGPTYMSDNNTVDVDQTGNNNDASFGLTWGDWNVVDISQLGNSNYTEFSVKYGDSNILNETVDGNSNRTRFHFPADWGTESSDNTLDITKDGDGNYVAGVVKGDFNDIDITQTGNNNRVGTSWWTGDGVNITGDTNIVDISQTGNGNSSLNTVTGNGNTINVTQSN